MMSTLDVFGVGVFVVTHTAEHVKSEQIFWMLWRRGFGLVPVTPPHLSPNSVLPRHHPKSQN